MTTTLRRVEIWEQVYSKSSIIDPWCLNIDLILYQLRILAQLEWWEDSWSQCVGLDRSIWTRLLIQVNQAAILRKNLSFLPSDSALAFPPNFDLLNWNGEKIIEASVLDSIEHLDTSLNTGKSGSNFTEKLIFPPIRFSPCLPIQLSLRQPELLTLRLTVLQKRLAMFSTNTTPAPYSTKPPCIVGALKNC